MTLPSRAKLTAAIYIDASDTDKADVRQYGLESEAALNALFGRTNLINGYIAATVAANALTVAIKTYADADPSSSDPTYIDFPSQTASDGKSNRRTLTAATSFTVSGGAKVGFADATAGALWVVAFDDGGTVRLGVINCYGGNTSGAGGTIYPMLSGKVASSTAEGGDGSADSAGVFYTGAAVSAKPFVVLARLVWETALATAGSWSAVPDTVHQQRIGDKLPGDVIQIAENITGAVATGTTTVPADDTIPQNSEGDQYMSQAITPTSKANVLEVEHHGLYAGSAAAQLIAALFQDTTANALSARADKNTAAGDTHIMVLGTHMLSGTTSSTTFKVRAGLSSAGTVTFNGSASARLFGGVGYSRLTVVERMA